MAIVIASGKGGTGKTTIALGLALSHGSPVTLLDTDVEEPNCQVLLRGAPGASRPAKVMIPLFDGMKCTLCGACARACRFNALAIGPGGRLLFPELCHGCGVCLLACERGAISEGERTIGDVNEFQNGPIRLLEGRLLVGETMSTPLIKELKSLGDDPAPTIIDAPPGNACAMAAAVKGADYCLLVTEPSLFGRHDLEAALKIVETLGVKHGVIINRSGPGDELIEDLCREHPSAPILAKIPSSRSLAEAYSRGELLAELGTLLPVFDLIWARVAKEVESLG